MGYDSNLITTTYDATDRLLESVNGPPLSLEYPIIIANLVNIDDLEESSTFGRTLSEYIASRLVVQHRFTVVEMKLRKSIFIRAKQGEFLLSRDIKEISSKHNAQAFIVGTYAVGRDILSVSLRLINAENNTILSAYDYRLPKGIETQKLLLNRVRLKGSDQ